MSVPDTGVAGLRRILVIGAAVARAEALARQCDASIERVEAATDAAALARESGADLLVFDIPRDARTRHWLPGAAEWQVLRLSPCPVLLADPQAHAAYARVLVAIDPLHEHDRPAALDDALVAAARAVAAPQAHIGLVHCHLPSENMPLRAPGATRGSVIHRRTGTFAAQRAALEAFAARQGIAAAALQIEPGDPREAIPEVATRTGADLVVLGAVARGPVRRFLIGSTTEPVIGRLGCDVLAVTGPRPTS